jgi:hypothetical protein
MNWVLVSLENLQLVCGNNGWLADQEEIVENMIVVLGSLTKIIGICNQATK